MEQDRTAFLFLLFPAILLTLRHYVWDGCMPAFAVQLYQVSVNQIDLHKLLVSGHFCGWYESFFLTEILLGLAVVPLYWFSIEGEYSQSQWKRHTILVIKIYFVPSM